MKLIQLPTQAFEQRLKEELVENPALEGSTEQEELYDNDDFNNSDDFDDDYGNESIDADDINIDEYLSDDEILLVSEELAHANKIIYFSVPTDNELKKQREEVEFTDRFAIRRSREKYIELMSKHFTFVGNRFLESKIHYNEETTAFSELLFRF